MPASNRRPSEQIHSGPYCLGSAHPSTLRHRLQNVPATQVTTSGRTGCQVDPAHGYRDRSILNVIHKADKPDVVVNFFDADRLAGKEAKTVLKLIFLFPRQMRPQWVTTMVLSGQG
jgi:hypothetical protein